MRQPPVDGLLIFVFLHDNRLRWSCLKGRQRWLCRKQQSGSLLQSKEPLCFAGRESGLVTVQDAHRNTAGFDVGLDVHSVTS